MERYTRLALQLLDKHRFSTRIVAAKQDIVSLGFPEIISKLLYEKYGNLAPLIAKWYKQYRATGDRAENPDWWRIITWDTYDNFSLYAMTYVYEKGTDPESFLQASEKMDVRLKTDTVTQEMVDAQRQELVNMIREKFFDYVFFTYYPLIQDITSGELTDVAPYKKLNFQDAVLKYDKRRHFIETKPIKVYPNGFKWIDVGDKSFLVGEQMGNCGSSGVMGRDPNRTILTLFGPNNKPHVMVTYSPNEKRISGDECAGSTEVKEKYHEYVLDLVEHLGAWFDEIKSRSRALGIKYLLKEKAQSIESLKTVDYASEQYFRFVVNGQAFYTDGYAVVSESDVHRVQDLMNRGELELRYLPDEIFRAVLIQANRDQLENIGIKFTPLRQLVQD